MDKLDVGDLSLRFLTSSFELWEEGREMRHCADGYAEHCQKYNFRMASVTQGGRRVATALFRWLDGELGLVQVAGKTNKPVPESLKRRLKGIQLPADAKCYELPVAPEVDPVSRPTCILRKETTEGDPATAVISSTNVFCREVEINPIEALTDTFHVQFTSQLGTAKDPLARQKNFELILSREELRELQGLIERTLN